MRRVRWGTWAAALAASACILLAVAAARPATSEPAGPETKVTPELERSVQRGLDYLARTQRPDGAWSDSGYGQVSGVVGLAMMTFLAHGETPNDPKYGPVIRRAVDYIIRTQEPNGLLSGQGGGSPMYSHGFATLALAEVYDASAPATFAATTPRLINVSARTQVGTGGDILIAGFNPQL
jgi:squalene cyclase